MNSADTDDLWSSVGERGEMRTQARGSRVAPSIRQLVISAVADAEKAGWRMTSLAEAIGIHHRQIYQVRKMQDGDPIGISMENFDKILAFFGMRFTDANVPEPKQHQRRTRVAYRIKRKRRT